jgi:hypothetical protein
MNQIEDCFDYYFGRLTALEVAIASVLATASEAQRAEVGAFLELAHAGGLNSDASEHSLARYEATKKQLLSLNPEKARASPTQRKTTKSR